MSEYDDRKKGLGEPRMPHDISLGKKPLGFRGMGTNEYYARNLSSRLESLAYITR